MTYQKKVSDQLTSLIQFSNTNLRLGPEVTWAEVKRQLAVEDHSDVESGKTVEGIVTPSAFIVAALELEDAQ
jgi:hypothetical protein